jgi:serine protease AprX
MEALYHLSGKAVKTLITVLLLFVADLLPGQVLTYSYFYRVYLKDKGSVTTASYAPEDLLSPRAINRRQKSGIAFGYSDIPVNKDYINQISAAGFRLHCTSKWMNSALFKTQSPADLSILMELPFVSEIKIVKKPGMKRILTDKLYFRLITADIPPYDRPVTMVNGFPLHNAGFDGKNVLIAILDGGFIDADKISSASVLRSRHGIISTYDFVTNDKSVYNSSSHGTAVLSVLAGKMPGYIEGTAPGADYLLLKTEDVASEFPCEEDFWAAGAEYADSSGADIISSSLGYFNFDDPSLNYKYSDLDGNTAFVTKAAVFAASKGILVVNSAGNERNGTWKRIIFPADGNSVVAVGAVDGNNLISDFSSAGPSADGRIKPDNVTMGVSVPVQTSTNTFFRSNGTSFSCPVLSGMAACLLQAVPEARNTDIIAVLHSCADRYNSPDSLYGYGIPDMVAALEKLQELYVKVPDEEIIAGPNPTNDNFELIFRQPPENLRIEIYTLTGKLVIRKDFTGYPGRTILITELSRREQGIYFVRVTGKNVSNVLKIIKLRNQP